MRIDILDRQVHELSTRIPEGPGGGFVHVEETPVLLQPVRAVDRGIDGVPQHLQPFPHLLSLGDVHEGTFE